jgi:CMP-N,N'-diacetyllegionaminic acid synthase
MNALGVVPARGGSKSILRKNLALLGGRPLLDYGVHAAQAAGVLSRIICSTDDAEIADRASHLGIDVDARPAALGQDDTPVAAVVRELLERMPAPPDIVVLIQPTSPFLLPAHVATVVALLRDQPQLQSAQTIVACPHNSHAWNQRIVDDGIVAFRYKAERERAYNKQGKPKHFLFGNLVAARTQALRDGLSFFAEPSGAAEIARPYDLDVDGLDDLALAEALLASGRVALPFLNR